MTNLAVTDEHLDALVQVLDVIRSEACVTRPEISARTGLGRAVVVQRVTQLLQSGLVVEGDMAPSTGGRPARGLRLRSEAGLVLCVELGATSIAVGLANLLGELVDHVEEAADIAGGPEEILRRVVGLAKDLLRRPANRGRVVWGVGIGLPGPVEFATGLPMAPPIMPGWDRYPVRAELARRFNAPVWVDNDVNLMALGELRAGQARDEQDYLFVKVGSGIGAGLISRARLHRGAQGVAGDVGHVAVVDDPSVVCRCGNIGCLEAVAGGAALGRHATDLGASGRSPYLARKLAAARKQDAAAALSARDLSAAAAHGDRVAVEALTQAGSHIGQMLATLVNFYNPSLIVIGGGVADAGDQLLAAVRQAVYRRSLPLATRDLRITRSGTADQAGLIGAGFLVIDQLFARECLRAWIEPGSPAGRPDLAELAA